MSSIIPMVICSFLIFRAKKLWGFNRILLYFLLIITLFFIYVALGGWSIFLVVGVFMSIIFCNLHSKKLLGKWFVWIVIFLNHIINKISYYLRIQQIFLKVIKILLIQQEVYLLAIRLFFPIVQKYASWTNKFSSRRRNIKKRPHQSGLLFMARGILHNESWQKKFYDLQFIHLRKE